MTYSQATQASDAVSDLAAGTIRVLLVDDQAIVAHSLRLLLRDRPNIELHYCPNSLEAIRTANQARPTIILQDWVMPSLDGLDLLRMFRANPSTADTPIIVLSSEDDPDVKRQAFAAGASDYLVKLPDRIELIARIESHSKAYLTQMQRDEAFQRLQESQQRLSDSNTALTSMSQRIEEAYAKLNQVLQETERRAREAVQLTELIDVLQSCQGVDEAYQILKNSLPSVLSCDSGALCIIGSSRNVVQVVAAWGHAVGIEETFDPIHCWALRRGEAHVVKDLASPLRCAHVPADLIGGHACIPLVAQGETLGVLYLEYPPEYADSSADILQARLDSLSRRASAAGQRISLTLANLNLREVLRTQSIRDPLTGLFNRRYMEESMERELRRAARHQDNSALLMLDIDHFKRFNDTFGHQAGDALLRDLGKLIIKRTRGEDVACRYGGEEFALILAGASVAAATKRAELLREEVKRLAVQHDGRVLGTVTLSLGIAVFPEHGRTLEELFRTADRALYQAKREGRDRSVVGQRPETS